MAADFGLFQFASPPRTATTWIRQAAHEAGLQINRRTEVHFPHADDHSALRLTCVRNPCDWVRSYYDEIYPGKIEVNTVDDLCTDKELHSFDDFVRHLLMKPGSVSAMFESYKADVAIRVEDLPWAFVEFLESLGVPSVMAGRCVRINPMNVQLDRKRSVWNPSLKTRFMASEIEFLERYEYM